MHVLPTGQQRATAKPVETGGRRLLERQGPEDAEGEMFFYVPKQLTRSLYGRPPHSPAIPSVKAWP